MNIFVSLAISVAVLTAGSNVCADEHDAKNFITVATGTVPSSGDAKIQSVDRQLRTIEASCASTSRDAGIHDKLAKAHSLLHTSQSLLDLLTDFVHIANAQCKRLNDSTLISLYVLERNSGTSHKATVAKLSKNPGLLVTKWSNR